MKPYLQKTILNTCDLIDRKTGKIIKHDHKDGRSEESIPKRNDKQEEARRSEAEHNVSTDKPSQLRIL